MALISKTTLSSQEILDQICPQFDFQEAFLVSELSPENISLKKRLASALQALPFSLKALVKIKTLLFFPLGFQAVEPEHFQIIKETDRTLVIEFIDRHFKSYLILSLDLQESTLLFENRVQFRSLIGKAYLKSSQIPHAFVIKSILKRI